MHSDEDPNPNYTSYAKTASSSFVARASPSTVWDQVAAIGGEDRYYFGNLVWGIRESVDWALGGPGRNRGRRHPTDVRVGDTIDSWHVIGVDPGRRLTLAFGMKSPGAGVLEFEVAPLQEGHTRVSLTAYWEPDGFWGLVYWYAFAPSHDFLFHGMAREIARRAERAPATVSV